MAAVLSADDESFLHGVAHLGAGRVRDRSEVHGVITATVVGGRSRTVTLGGEGLACACPQGRAGGAACEHQVAVALAHLRRLLGMDVNDLVAAWFEGSLADVAATGRLDQDPAAETDPAAGAEPPWLETHG